MMRIHRWVILLILMVMVTSRDEGDWVDPFTLPVPLPIHSFYAGYLDIFNGKQLFYVYTPSMGNPSKDPLVVVLSPGPGCSALYAWLYGYGEFIFVRDSENFRINPHNWNKEANILYIEAPAGVGYSLGVEEKVSDDSTQK